MKWMARGSLRWWRRRGHRHRHGRQPPGGTLPINHRCQHQALQLSRAGLPPLIRCCLAPPDFNGLACNTMGLKNGTWQPNDYHLAADHRGFCATLCKMHIVSGTDSPVEAGVCRAAAIIEAASSLLILPLLKKNGGSVEVQHTIITKRNRRKSQGPDTF
jgi:hypothetical protein